MWYFPRLLNPGGIVQFGNRMLSGLAPDMRLWADQQAESLLRQGRFTVAQQSQLEASIRKVSPTADPATAENLEAAVLYLALSKSVLGGNFSLILASPQTMTPFQQDILGPFLSR